MKKQKSKINYESFECVSMFLVLIILFLVVLIGDYRLGFLLSS